jgi:hypothetical protein
MTTEKHLVVAAALLAFCLWPLSAAADERGRAILNAMDNAMNFSEGRMRLRIEDHKANGATRVYAAEVLYVLNKATLIEFVEPPRDRGKRILTVGDSMWMAVPGTSRPIRLSGRDSFMGTSFTNDDVMNLDRSDDYDAVVAGEEAEGTRLVMTARTASVPYPRMEIVIGDRSLPVWSVLYTRSGAAAKRIEYTSLKDFGDKVRPAVMTVIDLMTQGDRSVVVFEEMRAAPVDRTKLSPASFGR